MNFLAKLPVYDSAQNAFLTAIQSVLAQDDWVEPTMDPTSIGSLFGGRYRKTKELICTGFALNNPRSRLIDAPPRHIDLAFAFANFIWTVRGDNDVSSISYYNPKGALFSDDGKHYAGALGYRMQRTRSGSQLSAVAETLKRDPSSRRALIQFYSDTDSILRPKDTPCIVSMHFLVRQGKLVSIVNMRSQSALMVMPYDLLLYTMLHELVAAELSIEVGTYFHMCGSLHIYQDEVDMATTVVADSSHKMPPTPMQPMPQSPLKIMGHISELEKRIRTQDSSFSLACVTTGLPEYWSDIIKVLVAGVAIRNGRLGDLEPDSISNIYRRWF